MSAKDDFTAMLEILKLMHNVDYVEQVIDDISKLVKTDKLEFMDEFTRNMSRKNQKKHNRYEPLMKLTKNQKRRLDGRKLYRYEYRKNSNFRCIYLAKDAYNNMIILLAFNEDGDKSKGKVNYDLNIEKAIKRYESFKKSMR